MTMTADRDDNRATRRVAGRPNSRIIMIAPAGLGRWAAAHGAELRLWVRMMVAGLFAFGLAELAQLPQGYWAVLTAILVMQTSVGGSVKATFDRLMGTLSGAVYGGLVAFALPHEDALALGLALAVALAPLALLAALNASFRIAPVTAIIVLMSSTSQNLGPMTSAATRCAEIMLGSIVGLGTALLVLPARAHGLLREAAANMLALLAELLPALLDGLAGSADKARISELQKRIRASLGQLERVATDARQERKTFLTQEFDPDPLVRGLLRLRHDLVMIGRAAAEPLPQGILDRLRDALAKLGMAHKAFLGAAGAALVVGTKGPSLADIEHALDAFGKELAALRREGLTRALPGEAVGRVFALGFALEQLRQDLQNLSSRTDECVRRDW
ncbi:MAG: FUSC family protein [Methylobacteriaceae bacterium]|nr:FUSC family protein [Methylobacteriaceae bacterium]